jgi:hypothetical protein
VKEGDYAKHNKSRKRLHADVIVMGSAAGDG